MKKNKHYLQSIWCGLKGIKYTFKTEHSFKCHTVLGILALVTNIITKSSVYDYTILLLLAGGVFGCELINTAIEHICDAITTEYNEHIKYAKDIAAGAVVFWGIIFFITEIIVIATNIMEITV